MERVKHFPKQAKVRALCRIWGGEKITEVARDYGISRQVIHTWKKKAEFALSQVLEEKKKGPKKRRKAKEPRIGKIHQEIKRLSGRVRRIREKIEAYEKEKSPFRNSRNGEKPQECPTCGCHKIYKNGTYIKKNGNGNSAKAQIVQRYVCAWCKNTIHVEE